jgi:hypothetical protein
MTYVGRSRIISQKSSGGGGGGSTNNGNFIFNTTTFWFVDPTIYPLGTVAVCTDLNYDMAVSDGITDMGTIFSSGYYTNSLVDVIQAMQGRLPRGVINISGGGVSINNQVEEAATLNIGAGSSAMDNIVGVGAVISTGANSVIQNMVFPPGVSVVFPDHSTIDGMDKTIAFSTSADVFINESFPKTIILQADATIVWLPATPIPGVSDEYMIYSDTNDGVGSHTLKGNGNNVTCQGTTGSSDVAALFNDGSCAWCRWSSLLNKWIINSLY